jgi:hypothetical protein
VSSRKRQEVLAWQSGGDLGSPADAGGRISRRPVLVGERGESGHWAELGPLPPHSCIRGAGQPDVQLRRDRSSSSSSQSANSGLRARPS